MGRYTSTLICAVLCATCAVLGYSNARKFSRAPDARFVGPGTYLFSATEVTDYTLWHDFTGSVEGEFSVREENLPIGTRIRITHAGAVIDAVPDTSTSTTCEHGQRKSVLHFTTPVAGEYQIEISGFPDKREFEITHGAILMPLLFTIGWIGCASLLALLTVVFALLAALRVFPRKPNQALEPTTTAVTIRADARLAPAVVVAHL